jgi:hypothetical protein
VGWAALRDLGGADGMIGARLRRGVAFTAGISMTSLGCSSSPIHFALPEPSERSSQLDRIAAVTVDVSVRRARFLSRKRRSNHRMLDASHVDQLIGTAHAKFREVAHR